MAESDNSTILEFVEPVLKRLKEFGPEINYDPSEIEYAIEDIIKQKRISDVSLIGHQICPMVKDEKKRKILIARATQVFVERWIEVTKRNRKRVPTHKKNFSFDLETEIYRLENGEMAW